MHGVRLVSTPPRKTAGSACSGLERSGSMQQDVYVGVVAGFEPGLNEAASRLVSRNGGKV